MGGDGGSASDYRTDGWQFTNESTLESWSGAHRFSSYVDVTSQQLSASHRFNTLGTFSFSSLADLESGNANRFTRSFGATTAQSRVFDATLGLGDIFAQNRHGLAPGSGYEPADGLTLQYGIRADFQRFSHSALYNPLVDSLLGVRTDHVPNSFAIQPMLGFVWNRGEYRAESGGALFIDTRSSLSGGIRLYRSAVPPDVVLGTQDETGLPVDERRLECVGDAVPMPDWPEYAVSSTAIPSECVQPAPSGSAVAPTPHVSLFAPDYAPTESWRGELRWRWRASAHLSGNVGSIYSIGAHRASVIDLNFDPQVDFRLQNEDGRPVYVPASGISSLGAAPLSGSRQFGSFGSVIEQRSDLKSTQAMLSAGLTYQIGATEFQGPQDPAVRRVSAAISATYTMPRPPRIREAPTGYMGRPPNTPSSWH
jgi:hypothetical protein